MSGIVIQNQNSFHHALRTGVNLFAGSGFSILSKDARGNSLPLGNPLCKELVDAFDIPFHSNMTLAQVSTILNSTKSQAFREYLIDRFTVSEFDHRYFSIKKINIQCILTTNIDDLFYKIYSEADGRYLNDIDFRGPSRSDELAVDAIWLHGCVRNPHRAFTFSAIDIASAPHMDHTRWQLLSAQMEKRATIIVGYSMNDAGFLQALHPATTGGRSKAEMWAVFPPGIRQSEVEYLHALGIQVVEADIAAFLNYVHNLDATTGSNLSSSDNSHLRSRFPNLSIPEVGSVPVRPLADFFIGAPPTWSDVFSHRLHRTEHFARIRDLLLGKQNVLVVGIPASGKTTLMMQLAADVPSTGVTLVSDSVTSEKADSILKRLDDAPAIVFIDQCCDEVDGFTKLVDAPNVIVAGFDDEHNLEIVTHLIPRNKVKVVPVTELVDRDVEAILETVAPHIRSRRNAFRMESSEVPSLFEIIESNILTPTLSSRYLDVMKRLEKSNLHAFDLLLVNCYVHNCRVPVSLDMLIAYFGEWVSGYEEIYKIREVVGSLIADAPDAIVEDNQDYYVPRSTLVSQAVLHQVSTPQLRRMLLRFQERVKPFRISRFDVFRRRAFDHKLIFRAFDRWQEGMEFYEKVYREDRNPYTYQHGALYLSRKKRYAEAFRWIDDAVNATGGRNFTIRNSHARIMFDANIGGDHSDPITRQTLFDSMDILSECYSSDRRKTYHAIAFAEHGLRMAEIYGFDETESLLLQASKWLREEVAKFPWHRRANWLNRQVKRKLSTSGYSGSID